MALLIDGYLRVSQTSAKARQEATAAEAKSWENAYAAADAGSLGVPPKSTPSSSPTASHTPGSTREVQSQLTSLGYNTGGVDGIAGGKTDAAVRAFQAANGLTVDGIIGPQTRAALASTNAAPSPISSLNQSVDNPFDDLPSPPSPGSPGTPGIPGITLPDGNLGPVSSPVVENPDYILSQWEDGYVDVSGTYIEDGQLNLPEINTRANNLFAEADLGTYGGDGVDLPHAAIQIADASDGGSAIRWDIGPEAAIPIAGADTSRNDNGDKVLEVFIPTPASTVTLQSDDPVGAVASPFTDLLGLAGGPIGIAADVAGEYVDRSNLTNTVTGGRWDPPTEQLTGLTSALNPDQD